MVWNLGNKEKDEEKIQTAELVHNTKVQYKKLGLSSLFIKQAGLTHGLQLNNCSIKAENFLLNTWRIQKTPYKRIASLFLWPKLISPLKIPFFPEHPNVVF